MSLDTLVRIAVGVKRTRVRVDTTSRYAQPANALHLRHGRIRNSYGDAGVEGELDAQGAVRQVQRAPRRDVQVVRPRVRFIHFPSVHCR